MKNEYKTIKLPRNMESIVDPKSYDFVSLYSWSFDGRYAYTRIDGKKVYMHRLIMGLESEQIDHINRNKLDNRRTNLRICNSSENNYNSSIRKDNTSGHKGVSWNKITGKWEAYVSSGGKKVGLGHYVDINEAMNARDTYQKTLINIYG